MAASTSAFDGAEGADVPVGATGAATGVAAAGPEAALGATGAGGFDDAQPAKKTSQAPNAGWGRRIGDLMRRLLYSGFFVRSQVVCALVNSPAMSKPGPVVRVVSEDAQTFHLNVCVRDPGGETNHEVTLARDLLARLAPGESAEAFTLRSFAFLLEREPKESVLRRFDIAIIGRYFPEFEKTIARSARISASQSR